MGASGILMAKRKDLPDAIQPRRSCCATAKASETESRGLPSLGIGD